MPFIAVRKRSNASGPSCISAGGFICFNHAISRLDTRPGTAVLLPAEAVANFEVTELANHFARHRSEFAAADAQEYERLADRFISAPVGPNLMECTRLRGDKVRYDITTEECAVVSASGAIRTYFRPRPCASLPVGAIRTRCDGFPDNIQYFRATCLEW